MTAPTCRCYGTNARYAVRCKRLSRPGEFTCGLHQDQDVSGFVNIGGAR